MTDPFPHLADPDQWIREQERRSAELAEKAEQTKRELAESATTVSSPDGAVSVTVNPGGVLIDLSLSRKADDLSFTQLQTVIMQTYQRATARAAARTVEIMAPLLADAPDSLAFLKSTMPVLDQAEEPKPTAPTPDPDAGFTGFRPGSAPTPPVPPRPARPRPARTDDEDMEDFTVLKRNPKQKGW